ncbi:uncharacterized protein BP5553_06136 [Venustampulla echinocandica]|uniref:Exoribonuclease phosphorolytic domain-containing protein n=1 Tax=Venustampulla echinocandica TaxID=2656787 RepID=A0A370TMN8_9HELO|nr:uncharacterized protein BP5553_06136 [Venustampulla echinocandica]RDL36784.1 hypothetical protein BP5553_06136 [Venustampulla echinocandica]
MTNSASAEPSAILSHLHRTDGSATLSQNGYTVIGAVNGPIEVQRRDELPEEAAIDVIVRPAAGVGGTRERHLESILQSTLRQIILTHNFPRSLIQVTLQVTSTPENDTAGAKIVQAGSHLAILPTLLQTAVLTLLAASTPLAMIATSVLIAVNSEGESRNLIQNPNPEQVRSANSVHVLGFTSHGELLLSESEGSFTLDEWDEVYETAKALCSGEKTADDNFMQGVGLENNKGDMMMFIKSAMERKIAADLHYKV